MTDPIITIQEGQLKGTTGTNIDGENFYKFYGIPYAKPPINELRFQPPQPIDPWPGIRDASKIGNSSVSRDDFTREIIGDEDCLYLNVYTRFLPSSNSELQPVMVYIHGGGFVVGSSRPGLVGPEFLLTKNIVLVTFNYRLGALGFLSLKDPELGVYGNMGLKDQNLVLKWVKRNIKNFNGDPDNVTIFGNSAGGASVQAHLLSPSSAGLFHKAIMQSGCVLNSWVWGSRDTAIQLANATGKSAKDEKEALAILKQLTSLEILHLQEKIPDSPYPAKKRPFGAVLEVSNPTEFLTSTPAENIEKGKYHQVPILMGYVKDEGKLLDLGKFYADKAGIIIPDLEMKNIIPVELGVKWETSESEEIVEALEKLYPEDILKNSYDPLTDAMFLVGIFEALKLHLKTSSQPIYLYRISLAANLNQLKVRINRTEGSDVGHSDELGYLFKSDLTTTFKNGSVEETGIRNFVQLWTDFASKGIPSGQWQPVQNETQIAVMDIGRKLEMLADIPERTRLEVWWNILRKYPLRKFS
ncbi:hypothetical protein ABEB36_007153 [Hypothenemus hampei]